MSVSLCIKCDTPLPSEGHGNLCKDCAEKIKTMAETEVFSEYSPQVPPNIALIQQAFPQLEIISQLGHGGMGEVFKARQVHLDRYVAVKILSSDLAERPAFAKRFAREGKILAKLNHPNIVSVFDFGQATVDLPDGKKLSWFYLILEFVDGVNLRQAMLDKSITPNQAVAIIPQICSALQYAHNEGVLHRDIKPENILLDSKGQIKIADFGIGKLVQEPAEHDHESDEANTSILTQVGTVLGTPKYMAPEQLESPNLVDHRADIYSLGLVFYELLTGSLPGVTPSEQSTHSSLEAPIDTIVYKAIKRNRSERYQSAEEFRAVVEDVINSRVPSQGTLVSRANNTLLITAVCVLMAMVVGWIGWAVWNDRGSQITDETQTTATHPHPDGPADTPDDPTTETPTESQPLNPLLVKNIHFNTDNAEELMYSLRRMSDLSPKYDLSGCFSWTTKCAMNAQGTLLATGSNEDDSYARIFDLATHRSLQDMPHEGGVQGIAFHPVLPRLVTTDRQGDVHVWDTETGGKLADYTLPDDNKAWCVAVSSDGKSLIAGTTTGRIFALDGETGEVIREFRSRHNGEICSIDFHPDGGMFATIGEERTIDFWNIDQNESVRAITYSTLGKPHFLCFSPTGSRIAVTSEWNDKFANVYRVDTGELLANYGGYDDADIRSVNFSPDERFVLTGDVNYRVVIWDALTKKPVWTDTRHQGNHIYRVILTPAQDRLIVASGFNPSIYTMPPEIMADEPPNVEELSEEKSPFEDDSQEESAMEE